MKNQYRYVSRSHLLTFIVIILSIYLSACSSSASSEVKITTRDQLADVSKDQDSQASWVEQAMPAVQAETPAQDSPAVESAQSQVQLLANAPAPASSEVDDSPLPTATATLVSEPTTAAPQAAQPANQDALPPTEVRVGFSAPNFTLTTLDGKTVQLSDYYGQNVLINYWVTWCDPCLEELGFLDKLGQEYQSRGFTILSVNGLAQNPLPDVESVASQNSLTFPILLDEKDSFYNTYLVRFLPTSFFIDENGIIRHIQLGSATEDTFRAKIEQLLSDQF